MVSGPAFPVALTVCIALCGAEASHAADLPVCLTVLAPVQAGAVPDKAVFAATDCASRVPVRAFRYDRSIRQSRVVRDLQVGDIVRRYPEFEADAVHPGQILTLVTTAGLVRVERQVEALQKAGRGQRLFVRAADGQVLSVQYEGE